MSEEYFKIAAGINELQNVGGILLGQLSIDHNDSGNDPDVKKTLSNILKHQHNNLCKVPSLSYDCNLKKIYINSTTTVRNEIEISTIDKTLQYDLLFCLEGFPVSKATNPNKKVKCVGVCVTKCPKKHYCCDRCKKCKKCNRLLPKVQQCSVYKLRTVLQNDILLRNLFSHMTLEELKSFLNGKHTFPSFPNMKNWNDLYEIFLDIVTVICEYMCDAKNFKNNNVKLLSALEKQKLLDKLDAILNKDMKVECDINMMMNMKEVFALELEKTKSFFSQNLKTVENHVIKEIKGKGMIT